MSTLERQRRRKRHGGNSIKRALLMLAVLIVGGGLLAVLTAIAWVISVADSAPNINQLRAQTPAQISEVFASNGQLLGYLNSSGVLRTVEPASAIPNMLRKATVAIEDRRFYQHGGVDYYAILRAGIRDIFGGTGAVQGGSTLTMQLVRNTYEPKQDLQSHNLKYKIIEAKLAEQLEKKHTRAWILNSYLNDVPYGTLDHQNAYGVGAASQMFFDKSPMQLDLAQIALLAGLPQAPTGYNPFQHPELARQRRHDVLQAMVTSNYISQAQADAADAQGLQLQNGISQYSQRSDPYVLEYVQQTLEQQIGRAAADQGGLKIYTTINPTDQAQARTSMLAELDQPGDPAASLVTINPANGDIVAMANSTTYDQLQVNLAADATRSSGSSFKVFALMTLIHDYDGNPNTTYYDSHQLYPGWLQGYPSYGVQTAEHSYEGVINVTKATTLSDNTVYAQLAADVGFKKLDDTAHAMGIDSDTLHGYPSEVIGGLHPGVSALQMADAYATLASGGYHHPPTIVSKVIMPSGKTLTVNPQGNQVFSAAEAYAGTQALQTVLGAGGTGASASYGCPAAGKTGTASNYTDAWFVGYTSQLSTAVWVGYPGSTASMNDVNGLGPGYGGTLAAPIWRSYMKVAAAGYCGGFTAPSPQFTGKQFTGAVFHFAVGGGQTSTPTPTLLPAPTTTTVAPTTPTAPTAPTTPTPTPTTGGQTTTPPTLYNPPPAGGGATPPGQGGTPSGQARNGRGN